MKQSRLSGALAVIIAQAMILGLGYITHLIIGRILGPGPYGIYGIVLNIQTITGLILTLGVPVAVSRFVAQDNNHAQSILKQALRIQLYIALAVSLSVILLAPLLASLLGDAALINYIRFIGLVVLLQAFYQVFIQYLSGMHHFNRQAILTGLYAIIKLAGAISLIFVIGVYGAFAGFAIGGVIAAIIGWYWTRGIGGTQPHVLPTKSFLSFAGLYVLTLVGLQLLISLDLFMVKALLQDDIQAGYYNAANTLARIPYMLLQGLAFIILPSVSALTKPDASQAEAARFIRDTLRYLIALIVPGVALAAATSQGLIRLFFSTDYLPAAPALTILIIGLGALAFYLLLSNIVSGAGHPRVSLFITVIIVITSAIAGNFLIPEYGLRGAAMQTTFAGIIGLLIISTYTFRTFSIPVPYRSIINIMAASASAVLVTYLWQASVLTLIPQYLLAGIVYLAILVLLHEVTPADRTRFASLHPALKAFAPSRKESTT